MTHVVIKPDLAEQLTSSRSRVPIHNEAGRRLGYFVTTSEEYEELRRRAFAAFTDEDIKRAEAALGGPGGRPFSEILEELERKWPST